MHKSSVVLTLEKHFLYQDLHTSWRFHFVYNYKKAIKEEHWDLISTLHGAKCVSFQILTSKYTAGVKAQCSVWFSRSSGFCKRCFVIWIPSLIFWPHSKLVPVQALDFVDFLIFVFLLWPYYCCCFHFHLKEKCDSGGTWSIQGTLSIKQLKEKGAFSKVTWNYWTQIRYQVWKGKWQITYQNGL